MSTASTSKNRYVSRKASSFTESVSREMTREALKHSAVNLSQGFPDFAAPDDIKEKAMEAIANDVNQYAITWGSKDFRDAIARKTRWYLGFEIDPETEITVTCGSTEGMISAMMATVDPGDEVVIFEPFYENYGPDAILSGATPRYVALREPDWSFDPDELAAAFNNRTKAIILNTPNNPTGKVFSRSELETIAALCLRSDPGDEVVIFEPFYENYGPDAILSGATPRYVALREPDWSFDPDELAAAFNNRTKAIILNTPNNPTGKVFSRSELETIAALCL